MESAPNVFLSHASEDKDRFVLGFATRLRERGVDVWLDKWEMLPGDSLVEKIFEEGLKGAAAVIVVLSANSVEKKWVKEELNAGIVAKLTRGTKVIPVVLDKCSVPEALKSTLWESISDLENYDSSLDRVVAAVFGDRLKPRLGKAPAYTRQDLVEVAGLQPVDNLVLKIIGEHLMDKGGHQFFEADVIAERGGNIPRSEVEDSLEMLERHGAIRVERTLGGSSSVQITPFGMEEYAIAYVDGYDTLKHEIIAKLVNEPSATNRDLQASLQRPQFLIDHVLLWLEERSLVQLSKFLDGEISIESTSAALRRKVQAQGSHSRIPELESLDEMVLKESCELLIDEDADAIEPAEALSRLAGITEVAFRESVEVLEGRGLLDVSRYSGGYHYRVTPLGMETYARAYIERYSGLVEQATKALAKKGIGSNEDLQKHLGAPQAIVDHILRRLDDEGKIKLVVFDNGFLRIQSVSAELYRQGRRESADEE